MSNKIMEELIEFTRTDMMKAFTKWYKEGGDPLLDEKEAYICADYMIELLKELDQ